MNNKVWPIHRTNNLNIPEETQTSGLLDKDQSVYCLKSVQET